jgi:hypothetical protein
LKQNKPDYDKFYINATLADLIRHLGLTLTILLEALVKMIFAAITDISSSRRIQGFLLTYKTAMTNK